MSEDQKYEYVTVKLIELKPDELNPNEFTEERKQNLANSLKRFDYISPIVIDQNNIIADGHHRVEALKQLGKDEVEVIRYHFKSDDERRLFGQTMNKLHGEDNKEKAIQLYGELLERIPDDLRDLLSFDQNSLDDIRQQLLDENKKAQRMAAESDEDNGDSEDPTEIGEELQTSHICPKCGYGFND